LVNLIDLSHETLSCEVYVSVKRKFINSERMKKKIVKVKLSRLIDSLYLL